MITVPRLTVYKQVPGADIEPGWWAVVHAPWWDAGARDRWFGPYPTRRAAESFGKHVIKSETKKD